MTGCKFPIPLILPRIISNQQLIQAMERHRASLSLFDINQKAMPVSPSGDHHWVNDGHVDSNDPMAVNFTTNGVLANDFQVAPDLYEGWDTPGVAIDFRIGRAVFQSA